MNEEDRGEMVADVRAFLNSKAFAAVMRTARNDCVQELRSIPVGDLRTPQVHARMKGIDEFEGILRNIVESNGKRGLD